MHPAPWIFFEMIYQILGHLLRAFLFVFLILSLLVIMELVVHHNHHRLIQKYVLFCFFIIYHDDTMDMDAFTVVNY